MRCSDDVVGYLTIDSEIMCIGCTQSDGGRNTGDVAIDRDEACDNWLSCSWCGKFLDSEEGSD